MLWGCIMIEDIRYAYKFEGKIDSNVYKLILEDEVLETIKYYRLEKENIIFQQDNTQIYTINKVKDQFQDNKFKVPKWLVYSLDLNPIENI